MFPDVRGRHPTRWARNLWCAELDIIAPEKVAIPHGGLGTFGVRSWILLHQRKSPSHTVGSEPLVCGVGYYCTRESRHPTRWARNLWCAELDIIAPEKVAIPHGGLGTFGVRSWILLHQRKSPSHTVGSEPLVCGVGYYCTRESRHPTRWARNLWCAELDIIAPEKVSPSHTVGSEPLVCGVGYYCTRESRHPTRWARNLWCAELDIIAPEKVAIPHGGLGTFGVRSWILLHQRKSPSHTVGSEPSKP
jgi:hypothetical protein